MAKVKLEGVLLAIVGGKTLRELEAFDEFVDDGRDALLRHGRKGRAMLSVGILENDPQAGAVALVIAGADGAGELGQFERERCRMREIEIGVFRGVRLKRRMSEEFHEDATGVIDEVAETLRDEDGVDVAGCGLLELEQVVIGEWVFERDFDCSGGPIGVGRDSYGHDALSLHHTGYFG